MQAVYEYPASLTGARDLTVEVEYETLIPLTHPIEKAVQEAGLKIAAVGGFIMGGIAGFLLAALIVAL